MWFKNLQIFTLANPIDVLLSQAESALGNRTLKACGSQDMMQQGWVPPAAHEPHLVVRPADYDWLIALGTEQRLLPAKVIQQEADRQARYVEEKQGFKLGRKAMKEIKEQVVTELLPRAFTQQSKTRAWVNLTDNLIVVDSSRRVQAEDLVQLLAHSIDELPAVRNLTTKISPVSAMCKWIHDGKGPENFTLDGDIHLRAITEDGREVVYKHGHDEDQVREHLAAGRLPVSMSLTFKDRVSFVLTEKLEIKRIEFLDLVKESASKDGDAADIFASEFTIMTSELTELIWALVAELGGRAEAEVTDPALA